MLLGLAFIAAGMVRLELLKEIQSDIFPVALGFALVAAGVLSIASKSRYSVRFRARNPFGFGAAPFFLIEGRPMSEDMRCRATDEAAPFSCAAHSKQGQNAWGSHEMLRATWSSCMRATLECRYPALRC